MYLHSYAINIEQKVRGLIGNRIDRYALGGMIDSDYIEYGGMVVAICAGLVKYYGNGNNEKIDKFLEGISEYNGVSFSDIGEEKIKDISDDFEKLVDFIKRTSN